MTQWQRDRECIFMDIYTYMEQKTLCVSVCLSACLPVCLSVCLSPSMCMWYICVSSLSAKDALVVR